MNQTLERIEFNLHTAASDDASIITPKEAFRKARSLGQTAFAVTSLNSVQDYYELEKELEKADDGFRILYGVTVELEPAERVVLLARNRAGLRGIYEVVSSLHLQDGHKIADRNVVEKHRKNLMCGSESRFGAVVAALRSETADEELIRLASRYDYLELHPSQPPEHNKRLCKIGKAAGVPVVAVGNCHYLEPQEQICQELTEPLRDRSMGGTQAHFRSTEEMLTDLSYLGEDTAFEVSVTNPNQLAAQIDTLRPLSAENIPVFALPNAAQQVRSICQARMTELYGACPLEPIRSRLEEELTLFGDEARSSLFLLAHDVTEKLHRRGVPTWLRDPMGSTLISYFLQISDVNPLPAHHRCPKCKYTEFVPEADSGYDLPKAVCPHCGTPMQGDGHAIPYETALSYHDLNIYVPDSEHETTIGYIVDYLGRERVAFGGTFGGMSLSKIQSLIAGKLQDADAETISQIKDKLQNIKSSEGMMPGTLLLLPKGLHFCDVTPLRKLEEPIGGVGYVTHMQGWHLWTVLTNISVIGSEKLEQLYRLSQATGIPANSIDHQEAGLCTSAASWWVSLRDSDDEKDILWAPNYWPSILKQADLSRFDDLIRLVALFDSIGIWTNNGEILVSEHSFRELIMTRDDIFLTLRRYGVEKEIALHVMETVRKGRFRRNTEANRNLVKILLDAGVPQWYLSSMKKIVYLNNKASIVNDAKRILEETWIRLHRPAQYEAVMAELTKGEEE